MFKIIESCRRTQPPAWAVLERQLIETIVKAAPIFLEKYTRPGGTLIWRKDYPGDWIWTDHLYESFFNWTLYTLWAEATILAPWPSRSGMPSPATSTFTTSATE